MVIRFAGAINAEFTLPEDGTPEIEVFANSECFATLDFNNRALCLYRVADPQHQFLEGEVSLP